MAIRMSNLAAIDGLDAITALLDAGRTLIIHEGSAPANCETVASGTLLATHTLGTPAFAGLMLVR